MTSVRFLREMAAVTCLFPLVALSGSAQAPKLTDAGNGVLRDQASRQEWTQHSSESGMPRHEAASYCSELALDGGGWSLPSAGQLRGLYDPKAKGISCGEGEGPLCKAPAQFRLGGFWYWSADKSTKEDRHYDVVSLQEGWVSPMLPLFHMFVLCTRPMP